ncbi:MAG: putative addiction module antidote protein [Devosia nanyangense]|uniref:Addiction module antidote protein n=1 Tax=Devosia nanyangense TaxID=1228055 RepID=A0A933L3Z8_9HYPH|nr:putative addiction module antidote protein [Devosia nanyangense]
MVELKEWDTADYLKTKEAIVAYLEAVFEDGDAALITHALGVIARSEGMTEVAKATGLTRASLYKALSADGHPEFATVLKVIQALGLKMTVAA